MTIKLHIDNEQSMTRLGQALAQSCPPQCVIYLVGELGAGKTTLARGFLRALGYRGAVKSPTYTLVEPYEINGRHYYHLDLYRLADPEELEFLGLRDWFVSEAVLLVEWPQRGQGLLPKADLTLSIHYAGQGRDLELTAGSSLGEQIVAAITGHWSQIG